MVTYFHLGLALRVEYPQVGVGNSVNILRRTFQSDSFKYPRMKHVDKMRCTFRLCR